MAERIVDSNGNILVINTDGSINTTASGTDQEVVGNVASGATDSGNPVKVGAVVRDGGAGSTILGVGVRTDLFTDQRSTLLVRLTGSNGQALSVLQGYNDGQSGAQDALTVGTYALLFNGSTWDRQRGAIAAALLASGARTTTQTGADITNYNHRGIKVILDMTVVGTGSVTVAIQGKSAVGTYYTILTGAAIVTNVTNVYTVFPGATAAANAVANDALPRTFRIVVTANNANAATYSVDYELIL